MTYMSAKHSYIVDKYLINSGHYALTNNSGADLGIFKTSLPSVGEPSNTHVQIN